MKFCHGLKGAHLLASSDLLSFSSACACCLYTGFPVAAASQAAPHAMSSLQTSLTVSQHQALAQQECQKIQLTATGQELNEAAQSAGCVCCAACEAAAAVSRHAGIALASFNHAIPPAMFTLPGADPIHCSHACCSSGETIVKSRDWIDKRSDCHLHALEG